MAGWGRGGDKAESLEICSLIPGRRGRWANGGCYWQPEFSVKDTLTWLLSREQAGAPLLLLGVGTAHNSAARSPSVWPCSPEGSSQSSRKAASGSLPPSKSHVRVSALDHSKLSTPLPRGPLPKLPPSSCLPPPGPTGCGSVGRPCVGKSGPTAAPSGSQAALLSSTLPASRSPGHTVPGMSRLWHHPRPLFQLACLQATFSPSYVSECFLTHILKFNVFF